MINHGEWLALTKEEVIDPELPICDPHHHFWHESDKAPFPPPHYLLDDLLKDIDSGHNVVSTVFMECESGYKKDRPAEMRPVGETEYVRKMTDKKVTGRYGQIRVAAGIVGFADLTLGKAVEPVLEAHKVAGRGRFKGIRHPPVWDPDPAISSPRSMGQGLLFNTKYREGFALLAKLGLSYDVWLNFHQLTELAELARAFPETTIILDHIGTPIFIGPYATKKDEVINEWKRGIAAVAACPNVVIKLGGLGMRVLGLGLNQLEVPVNSTELARTMSPFFLYCIEKFGADRCMFESNYPVDKSSYYYTVLWNAFKCLTNSFAADEKAALFHNNAVKAYRL